MSASSTPAQIGRYIVESVVGRGAMGVIYRAHDPDIDRTVAIKLIKADLLEGEERADFIARFRREAQASGRCSHPNIVAVHDFALHEGNPFLAMEFVDGIPLSKWMADQRQRGEAVAVATAADLALQVLSALAAAHALGVVHRDIKPANIILAAGNRVKVADFGISWMENSSLTQAGAMVGTPSYMSPEQCRGDAVDARSDLYSVGVVLFELLAGRKPFTGRNSAELFSKLLTEEAPDLAGLAPAVPARVCAVVQQSLAKTPESRFASAAAMAAALTAAMQGRDAPDDLAPNNLAPNNLAPDDRTVVKPAIDGSRGPPADNPGGAPANGFDDDIIGTLERRLAAHVGPIARHLVLSAARTADSLDGLCETLTRSIETDAARERFLREVRHEIGNTTTLISAGAEEISDADLETVQRELARHLGPVARVLVKRARPGAPSAAALWRAVSTHIDDADQRATFLRRGRDILGA